MTYTRSTKSRLAFALIAVCLFASITARSASAVEATINVCGDAGGTLADWSGPPQDWIADGWLHWQLQANCPTGMFLNAIPATRNWWIADWQYPAWDAGRVKFTKASFDLRGSDGSDGGAGNRVQGVRLCTAASACTPLISPPGPDVYVPDHHELSVADGTLPADTDRFLIHGGCTVAAGPILPDSCSTGRELQVSNLNLTFDDSTPPTVDLAEPDPLDITTQLVPDGWNNGNRTIWASATDAESGIREYEFSLNGARYLEWTDCHEPYSTRMVRLCTPGSGISHLITPTALNLLSGPNKLEITAIDAAGNRSEPRTVDFKYDKFRPIVSGLHVVGTNGGVWQANRTFSLAWTNVPDTTFGPGASPIVRARASVFEGLTVSKTVDSGSTNIPGVESLSGITLPNDGLFRVRFNVWDEGGNISDYFDIEVGVDSSVPAAPALNPLQPIGLSDLAAGASASWTAPAAVRSGICGYAMSVNGEPVADPGTFMPVPASATSSPLPEWLPDGSNYVHLRAISCSGVPGSIAHGRFEVDGAAPQITLTDPPAGGWYDSVNTLVASVPAEPGVQLAVSVDGATGGWADGFERTVQLDGGEHEVVVRARDALANQSARATHVRFDDDGPRSAFAAIDVAHPAIVRVTIADSLSGVASAFMQYRVLGEAEWHGFGPSLHLLDARRSVELAEPFPDTALADGMYELRVVAYDAAGHRSTGYSRADGSPAMLALPVRRPATVKIGFPAAVGKKKCKSRASRKCPRMTKDKAAVIVAQKLLGYGATSPMRGALLDSGGDPIGGSAVKVFESVSGAPRRLVEQATTGPDGAFTFTPSAGPSRKVIVQFDGFDTVAPAEGEAKLLVKGRVLFHVSRRADARSPIDIRGRVLSLGAVFPAGGKIKIQYFSGGGFKLFPVELLVSADGAFSARLRFPHTRRAVRYRLRAVVPSPQTGWPYEEAVSATRTLTAR